MNGFISKKRHNAMMAEKEKWINHYIDKLSSSQAKVNAGLRGIEHAMCYLSRCDDDPDVKTAIARLMTAYWLMDGDRTKLIDILERE